MSEPLNDTSAVEAKQPELDGPQEISASVLDRAVEAKLKELLPTLTAEITRQVVAATATIAGSAQGTDAASIINGLANQLAELTQQNDGRPYISPEENKKRHGAHKKLIERLDTLCSSVAEGKEDAPRYVLRAQIQDSDLGLIEHQIWEDRKIVNRKITTLRIPNEAMVPDNDTAREIFRLFMESIGGATGVAHHQGMLRDSSGKLMHMKSRNGLVGGPDGSVPALDMTPLQRAGDNPALATREAARAGLTLIGRGPDEQVERIAILGTVHEPAKVQRL